MFDQWVPDEPAPRARPLKLHPAEFSGVAVQLLQGLAWNAGQLALDLPRLARSTALRVRRGEVGAGAWSHFAVLASAMLIVAIVAASPGAAHGQRFQETLRLFHLTGGDLSDEGMKPLAKLDPSAAAIAYRIKALPAFADLNTPATREEMDAATNPTVLNVPGLTPEEARLLNAAIPFSAIDINPAKPFFMAPTDLLDETRAVDCLTAAVYYEAASEAIEGQQAVAQVILNRVRNRNFPHSVCGVVFQGSNRTTGCQFSFTCDGSLFRKPSDRGWSRARGVAVAALNGFVFKPVGQSTHYHADYVAPYWSTNMLKVTQIGAHIFYVFTGAAGQPRSFDALYVGGEPLYDLTGLALGDAPLNITLDTPDGGTLVTTGPAATDTAPAPPPDAAAPLPAPDITVSPAPVTAEPASAEPKKPDAPKRSQWRRLPTPRSW